MILCILCKDEDLVTVRQTASTSLGKVGQVLNTPLSATGDGPATHWFCHFNVNEKRYQEYLAVQNLTTMEISNPKDFLEKHGLKIVVATSVKPANTKW